MSEHRRKFGRTGAHCKRRPTANDGASFIIRDVRRIPYRVAV